MACGSISARGGRAARVVGALGEVQGAVDDAPAQGAGWRSGRPPGRCGRAASVRPTAKSPSAPAAAWAAPGAWRQRGLPRRGVALRGAPGAARRVSRKRGAAQRQCGRCGAGGRGGVGASKASFMRCATAAGNASRAWPVGGCPRALVFRGCSGFEGWGQVFNFKSRKNGSSPHARPRATWSRPQGGAGYAAWLKFKTSFCSACSRSWYRAELIPGF